MNGVVKPSKVTVYVKLRSVTTPPRIFDVQFGFGHTCGAENGLTESGGTVRRPFFGEIWPLVVEAVKVDVWDSTGLFGLTPGLKQSIVAVYVALRFATACVFPTPAISYELHVTERSALTVQLGVGVHVTSCAPFGPYTSAFATKGSGRVRSALGLVAVSEQAAAPTSAIRGTRVNR